MRTLTTAIAAALLLGTFALANPTLTFDDSGFDYRPSDDETIAYVDLERAGDELRFVLSNMPGNDGLPSVRVAEIADLQHEDPFGQDVLASVAELDEITVSGRGTATDLIRVNHDGANLTETVERYLATIQRLGYQTQPAFSTTTVKVFTFGAGALEYRVVFHAQNGYVQVRIAL